MNSIRNIKIETYSNTNYQYILKAAKFNSYSY